MSNYYFNEFDASNFVSTHTQDEIKQELIEFTNKAKYLLSKWSLLDDARELVETIYNTDLTNEVDIYFQAKALLSSSYVEHMKYIEFLKKYIDN